MGKNLLTVLGCGTSTGVPMPACHCSVCSSKEKRDHRMRTSSLIRTSRNKHILIDTSPDLRSQVLINGIDYIDAVIITHDHADHLHGIDDLRPFCFGPPTKVIPVYTSSECKKTMEARFPYIFKSDEVFKNGVIPGGGIPLLTLNEVQTGVPIKILDEEFTFFKLPHGTTETLCFSHEKLAHITDCSTIPPEVLAYFIEMSPELLIIDCIKEEKHDTHLNLDDALHFIEKIRAEKSGLTHMTHEFSYEGLVKILKKRGLSSVFPLYDGMQIKYS